MQRKMKNWFRIAAVVLGAACSVVQSACADWTDMSSRLPAQTNAVVAVNVSGMLSSPLAQKENWAQKWADAYDAGLMPVQPGMERVLSGAQLSNSLRDAVWRITQVEGRQPVSLEDIARAEGGYIERVWDKMAVVTSDSYFISLSPTLLANYTPANHQNIARWLRTPRTAEGMGLQSERLKALVNNLGTRSHILMALDVEDTRTPTDVRRSLDAAPVPGLDPRVNLDLLAHALAGIKTVVLSTKATDKFEAELAIEFADDPKWLTGHAKALATEFVSRIGLDFPDIEQWTVSADANTLRMAGTVSSEGMSNLLTTMGLRGVRQAEPLSDDPKVIARTSRGFYQAMVKSLDSFPRPLTYPKAVTWATRQAAVIERLPLVNVDPELIAWSVDVSNRLREMQLALAVDQLGNQAQQAGINRDRASGAYGYGATAYSGYYGYDGSYRGWSYYGHSNAAIAAQRAVDAERVRVMRVNQAESIKKVGKIMDDLGSKRNAIRAAMVAKYGIDF